MKSITIAGKRYKIREYLGQVEVSGKGVRTYLPVGITLDDPKLREAVSAALERYRENGRAASEMIQQRVRDGRAGIGLAKGGQP